MFFVILSSFLFIYPFLSSLFSFFHTSSHPPPLSFFLSDYPPFLLSPLFSSLHSSSPPLLSFPQTLLRPVSGLTHPKINISSELHEMLAGFTASQRPLAAGWWSWSGCVAVCLGLLCLPMCLSACLPVVSPSFSLSLSIFLSIYLSPFLSHSSAH